MAQETQERPVGVSNDTGVVRARPDDSRTAGGRTARLVDGAAVEAFCRERAAVMKTAVGAAIYVGLADRVKRGFFDPQEGMGS